MQISKLKPLAQCVQIALGTLALGALAHAASFTPNVVNGNTISGEIVTGRQTVWLGGEVDNSRIEGQGEQLVWGDKAHQSIVKDSVIRDGGSQGVYENALVVGSEIYRGGRQEVRGGRVTDATVGYEGRQNIFGGKVDGTLILGSGKQIVESGHVTNTTVDADGDAQTVLGGTVDGTMIRRGDQLVYGGTINDTILNGNGQGTNSSAQQNVMAGADSPRNVIVNRTINNGGMQSLDAEAGSTLVVNDNIINKGGRQDVLGATVNRTVINNGVQNVWDVHHSKNVTEVNDTVVNGGGQQTVLAGIVNRTQINEGGVQRMSTDAKLGLDIEKVPQPGGAVFDTTINRGGLQILAAGTATRDVVRAGGAVQQFAGGVLDSATVAGTLHVMENGARARNTLTLAGGLIDFNSPASQARTGKSLASRDTQSQPGGTSQYKRYTVDKLAGSGRMNMRTNLAANQGDQLIAQQSVDGAYEIDIQDASNHAPDPSKKLTLIQSPAGDAKVKLRGNSADVGAYEYVLEKNANGWQMAPTPKATQTTTVAKALAPAPHAVWGAQLQQLYQRLGELRQNTKDTGVWAHTYGTQIRLTSSGAPASTKLFGVEAGADHRFATAHGDWYLGGMFDSANGDQNFGGSNTGTAKPWSVGAYASWLHPEGWYSDFVVRYNGLSQDFRSQASGSPVTASYHQKGYTVSAEGGKRFALAQGWWVQPELELTAMHAQGVSYQTSYGTQIQQAAATSWLGRMELRTGKVIAWQGDPSKTIEPYAGLGVVQRWGGEPDVTVAGSKFSTSGNQGAYGLVSAGVAANFSANFMLYANVAYAKGKHYEQPWLYNVGLRYAF